LRKIKSTLVFFAIFSCEFSLYSLGYDYKTPVIGMIVAGGQHYQFVPVFCINACIIQRSGFYTGYIFLSTAKEAVTNLRVMPFFKQSAFLSEFVELPVSFESMFF